MSHVGFEAIFADEDNRKTAARLRQGLDIQFITFSIGHEKDVTRFGSGNHASKCTADFSSSRRSPQSRNKCVQAAPVICRAHMSKRIVEFPEIKLVSTTKLIRGLLQTGGDGLVFGKMRLIH